MQKIRFVLVAGLFVSFLHGYGQDNPKVTFSARHIKLEKAIDTITKKINYVYTFALPPGLLDKFPEIAVDIRNESPQQAMDELLQNTGLYCSFSDKTIFIKQLPNDYIPPPPPEITVNVVNDLNEPLTGAYVCLIGTDTCHASNKDGFSRFRSLKETDSLQISYTGYVTQDICVGKYNPIKVTLIANPSQLDATIVIPYGSTTQRLNTGNIYTVTTNNLDIQPITNPLSSLEGRVPGLVITQASGVPGAAFTVIIRGQNSLAQGKDPFFVVDGVPYAPNNLSLSNIASGNSAGSISPFNSIDPQNIESIEILKDADATAIYGSRGANGVILITTRKGKIGKPQLSLDLSNGISHIATRVPMMNTAQYIGMRREALNNDGIKPDIVWAPDLQWDTTRYTNFQKMLIGRTAHTTESHLSLMGGDLHTRYLVAAGYHDESTVFPGNAGYRRLSALGNLLHTSDDNRLQVRFSGMLGIDRNNQFTTDLTPYTALSPNAPSLLDPNRNLVWQEKGVSFTNPISFTKDSYLSTTNNVLVNGYLSYRVMPHWALRLNLGYNQVGTAESATEPIAAQDPAGNPTGNAYTSNSHFSSWIVEPQSDISDSIGKGILHLLVGSTWESQHNYNTSLSGTGFASDALLGSMNAAQQLTPDNNSTDYHYEAFFGRLTYNLKNTWLLNLSGRRDGSSRFGPSKRFGNFGAIGAGWIFSNAQLVKDKFRALSFGKLRGSYGSSGNDQIGDYQFLPTWSTTTTQPYQGLVGYYPTSVYNPDIGWETTRKLEVALELGFLKDRITLNSAWYRNRSVNQLIPYNLPFSTGFTSMLRNFPAVVQNSGVEFSIRTKNIESAKIRWTTQINLSIPHNKLVSFPDLANSSYAKQLVIGRSIHVGKGYRLLGVDRDSGVYRFYDANKNELPDDSDRVIIGTQDISYYGGISNNIRIGSWELDLFVEGRRQTGNNALTAQYALNAPGGLAPGQFSNQPTYFLHRWQHPGDHSIYQQYSVAPGSAASQAIPYYGSSSALLADASFIRLKTVALTWHFPAPMLRKMHLAGGRIYLEAQNLLTLTGYKGADPETQNGQTLPPLRTIIAGFHLNFN